MLSLMIHQSSKIKGIKLKEREAKLSQFADDTTLCLDGSEESFKEAIKILKTFSQISGLKMNNEKTKAVWIGSRKICRLRFSRDMNFCWDPGIFKVLGIKFCTDTDRISEINYEDTLLEIQRIMKRWNKRQLTPLGKITVVKTLAVSKIIHLFTNLPDPPAVFLRELKKICFQFLWDGK